MRVSKWGSSLAVRLPKALVDELGLKEGDELSVVAARNGAMALAEDHQLSFHDALIVAAAIEAGCDTLFTEDMQHGRSFGGLSIVNPFLKGAA